MEGNGEFGRVIELLKKLLEQLEKKPGCFNDIKTKVDGKGQGTDPGTAIANATLDANSKLEKFGETWCKAGAGKCLSGQSCKATLSDLSVDDQKTNNIIDTQGKTTGYDGEVVVSAKVVCACG